MRDCKKPQTQKCFPKDMDIFGNLGRSSLYPHNGSKTEAERKRVFSLEEASFQGILDRNENFKKNISKYIWKFRKSLISFSA